MSFICGIDIFRKYSVTQSGLSHIALSRELRQYYRDNMCHGGEVTSKGKVTLAKLTRPRLHDAVPRKRVFRLLDAARKQSITWIAAPPGAGKTTLVASYLEARKLPFFWYQLDAGDADPATFFWCLVELAAQLRRPKKARLPYLTPEYLSDIPGFARRFFRTLFAWFPQGGVLVLDNCQEVANLTFHQILIEAANEAPEGISTIAISRSQPPAELARLRANRQLAELRWEDLKLTSDECGDILQKRGISDRERIAEIQRAADGWAGGVVLLTAYLPDETDTRAINLGGKEAVFDYFAGQIFDQTPQAQREVLMKTALLSQVTPDAAVVLSGDANAPNVLDQLYRRQYFTDRRTEPQVSYRYHDLFREFLINRAESEFDASALSTLRLEAGRLLLASDEAARAIELLCRGSHLSEAQAAIIDRAASLLGQGRWKTLLESIKLLPEAQVSASAALLYWHGMAHIAADPIAARKDLEASLQLFEQAHDAMGQLTAIVGIIAAHFVQDSSISNYARWIDPMAALFAHINAWPAPAIELEARSMFLLAASHLRPDHPLLQPTALSVLSLMDDAQIDSNTRAASGLRALVYFMWTGEAELARRVNAQLETVFLAADALAVHIAMGYAFRALYQHLTLADSDAALRSVERALAIARDNGLAHSEGMASQFQGIISAAFGRDLDLAESALQRVATLGFEGNLNRETNYHLAQACVRKWRGDVAGALRHAELCTRAARANCPAFLVIVGSSLLNVYVDAGEYEQAQNLLDEVRLLTQRTCFDNFGAILALEEAYLALRRKDRELCHARLRAAFRLAQRHPRHAATLDYMGGSIPVLFAEALKFDIESDYVRELIVRWKVPVPSDVPAVWPWPLSVQTLGKFEVKLHGKPIEFGRKAPRKVLELLKAIIAFGGKDVAVDRIHDALWPDLEADAAHRAFATALYRLRKVVLEVNCIVLKDGKLSLDLKGCRVDALVLDALSPAGKDEADASSHTTVAAMYGGAFLPADTQAPWTVSMRERLRRKFILACSTLGREYETSDAWDEAIALYSRVIDADDLAEEFYQGLMRCYLRLGRQAEAVTVFRRLRERLSVTLGLAPSAASAALFERVRTALTNP